MSSTARRGTSEPCPCPPSPSSPPRPSPCPPPRVSSAPHSVRRPLQLLVRPSVAPGGRHPWPLYPYPHPHPVSPPVFPPPLCSLCSLCSPKSALVPPLDAFVSALAAALVLPLLAVAPAAAALAAVERQRSPHAPPAAMHSESPPRQR